MIDVTSNEFWNALHADVVRVLTHPGMEIQLFLSALAIAIATLASLLIQRISSRKWTPGSKYGWVTGNLMPALLSPVLVIVALTIAAWISIWLVPIHQRTIAAFIKIAMVWLLARVLLLIAQRHFMAYLISSVMLVLALLSVTNLLTPTQASLNDITFEMSNFRLSLLGLVKGTFTLVVLFWGAGILSKTGETWLRQLHHLSFNARELAVKFLRILLYALASVLTLNTMGVNLTALTVFGGALAVGLGFGLQKITSNFISGIILLFEHTLEQGDLIEVGGDKGWVREMAIRYTRIETADGRELLIPNEDLITGKVINWTYTNSRARLQIDLTVLYDSDPETVRKILRDAAADSPHILKDPAPDCYLSDFTERGMRFSLVFWIDDIQSGMNSTRGAVMVDIVREFRAAGIRFAIAN